MRIGIDARFYGPKHTGIGRYVKNLIDHLIELDHQNQYILFGDPHLLESYAQYSNVTIKKLNTKVYSFAEQFINPIVFLAANLDLLHVPHLNSPILYPKKIIITIHDLIKHLSVGPQTTTLPLWQYGIKHFLYRVVVYLNVKRAAKVITPTHYWKNDLIQRYHLEPSKVVVTYEAVDWHFSSSDKKSASKLLSKYNLNKPFVIHTGNLYPHKNVNTLVKAVEYFNRRHTHHITLALIVGRSVFHHRLPKSKDVVALDFVPDADMSDLYSQALCLVEPSFIEGFGLTGLEAMAVGLPVISSSASCLPEVYQDAALYFDPYSYVDLAEKLLQVFTNKQLRLELIKEGFNQVKLYSWKKTAQKTLKAYQSIL